MKILFTVEFYEPRKGGAEEVVKQLAERLSVKGHEVTVATTSHPERSPGKHGGVQVYNFNISGNRALGIRGDEDEKQRFHDLVLGEFDVVVNYAAQNWTTDLTLDILSKIRAKKVLIPCGYSGLHDPRYRAYFEKLPGYLKKYDALIYMSEHYQDKQFGDHHGLGSLASLIPNGADEGEFSTPSEVNIRQLAKIKTQFVAITVANHYVKKGHRFVIKAFKAMKRRDTTLLIVGQKHVSSGLKKYAHLILDYFRCRAAALSPSIKLIDGSDRATVIATYQAADIFLFGSELECAPLVTYEAFASNTPFITRPVGNVADHSDYLKIATDPYQMASTANQLLDNDELRDIIGAKAYAYFKQHHTWAKIANQYDHLFTKLINARSTT